MRPDQQDSPGAWRRLQLVVAGAIVLAALGIARQLVTTDFGFSETLRGSARVVTEVDPGGAADRAGIAVGDVIVADPGVVTYVEPWTEREIWAWNRRLGDALRSGHVPMRIRRAGTERLVDVEPGGQTLPAAIRQLRRAGPFLPTMFAFLAMAAVLARGSRRGHHAQRVVAYSFACLGPCWAFNFPAPGWPRWMMLLSSVVINGLSIAGLALLATFVWTFPTRSRLPELRTLKAGVVAVGTAAAVVSILDNSGVIAFVLPGNQAQITFNLAMTVVILVGLIWQVRSAAGIIARRQARALLGAVVVGFGLTIAGVVAPQLLGINSVLAFTIFFPAPGLVPIVFGLAVLRYRLFDADGLAPRAAIYAVVIVTSVAVYVAVMAGLEAAFSAQAGRHAAAGRWLGFLLVLGVGEPLRALGQRVLDRWLARDRRAFVESCSRLAAVVGTAPDPRAIETLVRVSLDAREARVLDLEETLAEDTLAAVQARLVERAVQRVVEIPDPAAVDALLALEIEILVAMPSPFGSRPLRGPAAGPGPTGPRARALGLTLPMAPHLLDAPVRDALANVGRVIGTALSHDAERAGLASKLREAAEERAHIAMELHDGTGATLAAARLLAQLARSTWEREGADPISALDALDRALKDALVDMRSTLWTLDESHGTWAALAAQVRRHAGDVCSAARLELAMTCDDVTCQEPSARVRLAVFRLVQEALNNAVRHAGATRVRCALMSSGAGLELKFEDDGVGLPSILSGEGRGLKNMRFRVETLGGRIAFERPDAGGTRIVAHIPWAPNGQA